MSGGDGDFGQRKEDHEQEMEDTPDAVPLQQTQRPRTARHRAQRERVFVEEDEPQGAVGGEGVPRPETLTEQEVRVGQQAQRLLEMFIWDRTQTERLSTRHSTVIREEVCTDYRPGQQRVQQPEEDYLDDVSLALRNIGDQLAKDYELNNLIDKVPIQSPKEIFMKVCKQLFQDGQFNWGRVVALFYFAYRLIVKAIVTSAESVPWMKEIFSWAIDFFYQYLAWWIIQRGGWKMIQEYWGSSPKAVVGVGVGALIAVLIAWWKTK